jgi:hypothetical protein
MINAQMVLNLQKKKVEDLLANGAKGRCFTLNH